MVCLTLIYAVPVSNSRCQSTDLQETYMPYTAAQHAPFYGTNAQIRHAILLLLLCKNKTSLRFCFYLFSGSEQKREDEKNHKTTI